MSGCKWLNHCFIRFFRWFCCKCCSKNLPKAYKFYDHLEERIESDLNMVDIIKKIRYMQIMMNSTHLNSESRRYKLYHTFQNILDLEDDEKKYPKQKLNIGEMEENPNEKKDHVDNHLDH